MKVYPEVSKSRVGLSKKARSDRGELSLLADSLRHQTTEFFNNSTLHGVRYIAEKDRPFCEKFMWFSFTAVGAVTTCIIIVSLWEKFQTNPTITGLDTDFHNWDVPFPAVTICDTSPVDEDLLQEYLNNTWNQPYSENTKDMLRWLASLSYQSIKEQSSSFLTDAGLVNAFNDDDKRDIKTVVFSIVQHCDPMFYECEWKSDSEECCDLLFPVFTEMGFCYAFNSRHAERVWPWQTQPLHDQFLESFIHETDAKWSFMFNSYHNDSTVDIYIHSSTEMAGLELSAQLSWDRRVEKVSFSVKHTYTTEDARQLSIRQRRCVFANEQKLQTSPVYTYSACMRQCRMRLCQSLCKCVPHFYPSIVKHDENKVFQITDILLMSFNGNGGDVLQFTQFIAVKSYEISISGCYKLHATIEGYRHCKIYELECISKYVDVITDVTRCACELGCSHTVYEVEKLTEIDIAKSLGLSSSLEIEFVSWPMVRYKREVLFGWVDLLVSFGGIAGLFLGFSLLSGVEIIYYFTLRACCTVVRDADMLRRERAERLARPKPAYNLSLVPCMPVILMTGIFVPLIICVYPSPLAEQAFCPILSPLRQLHFQIASLWRQPPSEVIDIPITVKGRPSQRNGKPPQYSPPPGYTTFLP